MKKKDCINKKVITGVRKINVNAVIYINTPKEKECIAAFQSVDLANDFVKRVGIKKGWFYSVETLLKGEAR